MTATDAVTLRREIAIDAFVDAGLDCRDEGVLPIALEALIATGALDELIAQRWENDPTYRALQKPRRPKPSGGSGCAFAPLRWLVPWIRPGLIGWRADR